MMDWSQIVEQHGPLVWQIAQRLLCHEADTADCFQRTFIAALELSQQETIRHWPALLRRLATARALEQLRQRIRERNRLAISEEVGVERQVDDKAIKPTDAAQASELAENLRIALSQIDPRQAEVFCLACLDECSYAEIAAQLRLTTNHVGMLLSRAKEALREQLKPHEPEPLTAGKKSERNR
ncbi:MAG TPA: RNA polymerase sigma factor [Pirellulales bacterium]|jgi:RNA polymerase sigma-70 factor (ECF subfamily)